MSQKDDELRYVLGLIIATQEYLRETDPQAGEGLAAYLRAIAKTEREEGSKELADRFEGRADDLEQDDDYDS